MLQPNEMTAYLGCLINFNVFPTWDTNFLIGMVRKHLSHWANRSMSFVGISMLLWHIIWVIHVYHLMLMSLNSKGFENLESIAREFLWGRKNLVNSDFL